jgi:23S rRNA (uridine2552-2'-O)-methyltransferase
MTPKKPDKGKQTHTVGGYVRKDPFYYKAKQSGFVARSVFKLEEIDRDFKLLTPKSKVLDLGCAPGSWLQYTSLKVAHKGGAVVGVDLDPVRMAFGPEVRTMVGDIYETPANAFLDELALITKRDGDRFDVVLSDMAPHTTGIRNVDQDRSLELCLQALEVARGVLKKGGHLCVKILEGGGMPEFLKTMRTFFNDVKVRRPESTRGRSMETFVIGFKFKGE